MNVITHAAMGIALSRFFPPEYLPAAVVFSLLPDVDHLLSVRKWKPHVNGFETSQTAMHGVLGAALYSTIGLLALMFNRQLASLFLISVAVHLFLDFISGASVPFKHIEENPVKKNFGNPPDEPLGGRFWIRFLQEASVIAVSLLIFMR
jgi:membrane-bound metal-dependent hydrolase YbcI (DUF457 family)